MVEILEVQNWIEEIVHKRFGKSLEDLSEVELFYLYYEIKLTYGVTLTKKDIDALSFTSSDELAAVIAAKR